MSNPTVSAEFLLWTELCALWSIFSYAITADPLPEDRDNSNFSWKIWRNILAIRIIGTVALAYLMTHSIICAVGWQPWWLCILG